MKQLKSGLLLIFLCSMSFCCGAETLQEMLVSNKIPASSFSQADLSASVQGVAQRNDGYVLLAYRRLDGERFIGQVRLVGYDEATKRVSRKDLPLSPDDLCSGAPYALQFTGGYGLFSVSLSPSAECTIVLEKGLNLREVLYGFSPIEVAPGLVVITENMIHFAPVHPGRLQLVNLHAGKKWELYPPKDDALRARLIREHAKHIPSEEVCARMNDPS